MFGKKKILTLNSDFIAFGPRLALLLRCGSESSSHYFFKKKASHRNASSSNALTNLVNFDKFHHKSKKIQPYKISVKQHRILYHKRTKHLKGLAKGATCGRHMSCCTFFFLFGGEYPQDTDNSGFIFWPLRVKFLFIVFLLLSFFVQIRWALQLALSENIFQKWQVSRFAMQEDVIKLLT